MAQIREELILADQFTGGFTKFIALSSQSAAAIQDLQYSLANIETATAATAQAIQEMGNRAEKSASGGVDNLTKKILGMAGAYLSLQGISRLFGMSDALSQTTARIDRMNDGLQTTEELNRMIYESAQRSRGSYQQTADLVSKIGTLAGDAFDNNSQQIVAFAEQVNKQIVLSGASSQAADAALLQLTQAMSSGVLRGEELNSILEQTPVIAQNIAKYMGVSVGEMRELASEGKVTAEVVKNAVFSAAAETNEAFNNMPMTWAQVWTSFKNTALMAFQPVLSGISWMANNLDLVVPVVLTAGAAFGIFLLAANWINICNKATSILTGAQKMLKAAMAAGWAIPLIAIVAVVGAVYLLTAAFNRLTGSSVSATGIIAGTFGALAAFVLNATVVPMINWFSAMGNFIANVFTDPVTAVKVLFYDMMLSVLGYIQKMAGAIETLLNSIPGVEVDITSKINGIYDGLAAAREQAVANGNYNEVFGKADYFDPVEMFADWYDKGANLFSGAGGIGGFDPEAAGIPTYDQLAGIGSSVDGIAKSVDMSQEDLKSLVDVAERRYVNHVNLTTQAPVIQVSGQNTGNTAADRKRLADSLRDMLLEQISSGSSKSTSFAY